MQSFCCAIIWSINIFMKIFKLIVKLPIYGLVLVVTFLTATLLGNKFGGGSLAGVDDDFFVHLNSDSFLVHADVPDTGCDTGCGDQGSSSGDGSADAGCAAGSGSGTSCG